MITKGKCSTFTLVNYFDVWGNPTDGYEVNNQCIECNDLVITDDATDKEICEYLRKAGYLATSDMRKIEVVNYGIAMEIRERKTGKPLFGLITN